MSKIGIIGGAFDPIHLGHTKIMAAAIEQLNLDQLLIIPTKNNPWKEKSIASDYQRIKMIQIATRHLKKAVVDTIEIDMDDHEKNYTIHTIEILKRKYAEDDLFYIVGMDQANLFDKWKKAKQISKLVSLVTFARIGYKANDNIEKYHFQILNVQPGNESSTAFKEGKLDMVDKEVLKYISREGLYLKQIVKNYMSKKRYEHTCSVARLAAEFAKNNGLDEKKAYIAGMLHDVAKEMDKKRALELMKIHFSKYVNKPETIYHQWLSAYMAKHDFLIDDEEILQAIMNHTTASPQMAPLDMCVYCADKLDPLRGYDSSKQITTCNEDIVKGFRNELHNFYEFSKKKNRNIDECFFEVYKVFCKGDLNG